MHVIFEPERGQRVPIRVWARRIDTATVRQLQRIASQPFVVEHVAAMADVHVSDGVAVGTVFATENTVLPKALGGDLGCGMTAVRLDVSVESIDRRTRERIVAALGAAIPTGSETHKGCGVAIPGELLETPLSTRALEHTRLALSRRHLGTLGGGNHFIELERDVDGALWLLVHSGSRGLGVAIAQHHARAHPTSKLVGLDTAAPSGAAYVRDLTWALEFARANRRELVQRSISVLCDALRASLRPIDTIDIHHNFIARERWFGRDLLVHRKGAVAVPVGRRALIPGSMGTASYIVEGRGEPMSFGSCSHGAGRVLTRREARERIRPGALTMSMRGIAWPEHLRADLVEEAPSAYRDITEVLEDQDDLVRRVMRLEPIAVVKG